MNKVDSQGMNVFEGGFLGLDNITVVDRSEKLPDGAILEQSDATGWMGFFCLHMMRIAIELAKTNKVYESMATKFFEHFIYIGGAMKRMGGRGYQLWDEEDGFFYDVLRYPSGEFHKFRVRSLVGLIPLYAIDVLDEPDLEGMPMFVNDVHWFIKNRPDLVGQACYTETRDGKRRDILSIVDRHQLEKLLKRVWDESEFLSPGGIRSLSKYHDEHPFSFGAGTVRYEPAEADVKIKGGNSNWRGPIWFPTSYLLIESFAKFSKAFGPEFKVTAPATNGKAMTPGGHGARSGQPDDRPLHARQGRHAPHLRRHAEVPAGPALARPAALQRVLPRRQRRGPRREPPDRLDRPRGESDRRVAAVT